MVRLLLWAFVVTLCGCTFDRSGITPSPTDGTREPGPSDLGTGEPALTDAPGVKDTKQKADQPGPVPCAGLTCPLGCNVAADRCYRVKPTGHDASGYFDALTATVTSATADITINTTTGEIRAGATILRPPGQPGSVVNGIYWSALQPGGGYPGVSVFGMASLLVPQGRSLLVIGSHALAIYTAGDVTIAGSMVAAADGPNPGPGGVAGGANNGQAGAPCFSGAGKGGGQSGIANNEIEGGGGGGGRGAAGGTGGSAANSMYTAPGGAAGDATGSDTLWPLLGGCGGGAGGGPDSWYPSGNGGYGGGGGGAIQIVANGTITVSDVITAPGGGGEGGHYGAGGGGGGAGGAILLEAITVTITITGVLAANGGGGGAGGASKAAANATNGSDGQPSGQSAPGGVFNSPYGAAGGSGGALAAAAGSGDTAPNGGGGGGGPGKVRLNAQQSSTAGIISPAPIRGAPATW
jgi:hypothetical protein